MRPVRAPALLLAAIVLAVAACGGGGAATPGQTQTSVATSAPGTSAPNATAATETAGAEEPTEAPAASGTFDACKLLTIAEVKAITGAETTADPEGSDLADWVAGTCWWNSADMKVRFNIDYGDKDSIAKSDSPTAQEQFDITKAVYETMTTSVETVSGVGDMAFAWEGGAYAIKGDKAILVTAIFTDKAQAIAILKAAIAKI